MNIGIIDIGSNTIRLNVYELNNKSFHLLFSKKENVGLISYVYKNNLSLEGITKLKNCLLRFKTTLEVLDINIMDAFATASLRNLDNSKEVLSIISNCLNIQIEIISGSTEGKLSFLGAMHQIHQPTGLYIDSGGASTEFVFYKNFKNLYTISLNIGSLNLFNKFVDKIIPTKEETLQIQKHIFKEIEIIKAPKEISTPSTLTVTGGNMRAIRSLLIHYGRLNQDEYTFSAKEIHELLLLLSENKTKTMRLFLKIKPDRVHTMFCGLLILDAITSYFSIQNIQICTNGVREGYLIQKYIGGKNENSTK